MNYNDATDFCYNKLNGALPVPGKETVLRELFNSDLFTDCNGKFWLPLMRNGTRTESKINESAEISFSPWKNDPEKGEKDVESGDSCAVLSTKTWKYEKAGCTDKVCFVCQVFISNLH